GCPEDQTISDDGVHAFGPISDNAGNAGTDTVVIRVDRTKPTIAGSTNPSPNDGENGWFKTQPTIHFACHDDLSGIDSCTGDQMVTDTLGQDVNGTAVDRAGNQATTTVHVKVDSVKPNITA